MKRYITKEVLSAAFLLACLAFVALTFAGSFCSRNSSDKETSAKERHTVQVFIKCGQNYMFDKYDVDVFVDEEALGSIEHGGEATYELYLSEGLHGIYFKKKGTSVPAGSSSLVVENDGDKFSYRIYCNSEDISVEASAEKAEDES